MTTQTITFAITLAGFIIGIITTVAKLSVEYGRLKKEVEANALRDKEEREHSREKFSAIYAQVNSHDSIISKVLTITENLQQANERIEAKLDRLIERDDK